ITVHGVNAAPVAVDDAADVQENGVLNGASLLDNDSDPDGDELVINMIPIVNTQHGHLEIHSDGTYTYTPNEGYYGTDSFVYEVCDTGEPQQCNQASVTITVLEGANEHVLLEGFSPNGDGVNDTYVIEWLHKYNKVKVEFFNRWGNVVYRKDKYANDWNGVSNVGFTIGDDLPVGTYYYIITIDDTGEKMQGYIYLNR
uniref:T9SS type B sorting domain-containing protein n=1 Tax=Carboxylicivirga taeanensis TaxID=1416875 RepID=UPI003F6E19FE